MTATNHALTGACIATFLRQPFLALPLAYISHFVCDAVPHFGIDMNFRSRAMYWWLAIDGIVTLTAAGLLISIGVKQPLLLAMAGFAAMSPDLAWLYYGLKGDHGKPHKYGIITQFHSWIQSYQKIPGLFIEFAWATLMIVLIWSAQQ